MATVRVCANTDAHFLTNEAAKIGGVWVSEL